MHILVVLAVCVGLIGEVATICNWEKNRAVENLGHENMQTPNWAEMIVKQ